MLCRGSRGHILAQARGDLPSRKKTALITGGNSGIGFETAKSLTAKGYAVLLGCRDSSKGESAKKRILDSDDVAKRRQNGLDIGSVELAVFDLADLKSVKEFSSKLVDSGRPIDILLNNAGIMACPEMRTKDGFEMQFGVNVVSHFLLTSMLLPLISQAAEETKDARVINVASAAHLAGTIDFEDIMYEKKSYSRWGAYSQSKLGNVMLTYELARRLPADKRITCNALHPGVVATELGRYLFPSSSSDSSASPWWVSPVVSLVKQFTLTPAEGARTNIYLASDDAVTGISGKYFDTCKPIESSSESYDVQKANKLWDYCSELCDTVDREK